mgnify:CR=1 FL=1|tara:strand:+ start:1045 stop:1239 length:195 start_codon:yes stop_codon:yes gene_type:complete
MKDKVKEQKEQYLEQFNTLVSKRKELVEQVNEVSTAMEQVRGAFAALSGLEEQEDKPAKKKDKK